MQCLGMFTVKTKVLTKFAPRRCCRQLPSRHALVIVCRVAEMWIWVKPFWRLRSW